MLAVTDPDAEENVMAAKCRKCHRELRDCPTCRGKGKVGGMFGNCTSCNGTGLQCNEHGKHWR